MIKLKRKDKIFKILFALEVACLPLIISAKIMMPIWCMSIFVAVILVCKLGMTIVKNPANMKHLIIDAVGNSVVFDFCMITYCCYGYINVALTAIVCISLILEEIAKVYFYFKPNTQLIDALNFSNEVFIYTTLASLLFFQFNTKILQVSLIATIITSIAIVLIQGYRFVYYYLINNQNKKRY